MSIRQHHFLLLLLSAVSLVSCAPSSSDVLRRPERAPVRSTGVRVEAPPVPVPVLVIQRNWVSSGSYARWETCCR